MILKLLRFESEVVIEPDAVATLQIEDRSLFARAVASLSSEKAEEAEEPYALWDDDGKKHSPRGAFLVLDSLPSIPLNDRKLLGKLYTKIAASIEEDVEAKDELAVTMSKLQSLLLDENIELWGTYEFNAAWEVGQILKAFSFQLMEEEAQPLLDSLVGFFGLCADVGLQQPLLLVNAKSFFTEEELSELASQAFFYGISLLMLESWPDGTHHDWERKTRIDQWFLEN